MNSMIKKTWIGLMLGMGLLAGVNANAADLTIISAPTALTSGNALVFTAAQAIGTESAAQTVTLTASVGPVTFDALGIANPNFSMQDNTCGATLAIATPCTFSVKFTPEAAGTRYAELIIRSDALNANGVPAVNGAHTVYLQGTAPKSSQTIAFGSAPAIVVGGTGTVTATGGGSGNPVTFASATGGICSVSGSTVTGIAVGTCTIAADQAGNANYTAAPQKTQNIAVTAVPLTDQTINFTAAPASIVVGLTGTVSATGGGSGNAVTFTSATGGICSVSGSTVTGIAAGTCIIAANQLGNGSYNPATTKTQNIAITTVAMINQTIAFGSAPAIVVGGSGTVTATGGGSGNTVTFTSATGGICSVSGSTVTGIAAGTCTIAANQAGNGSYNAALQVLQNITISGSEPAPSGGACNQVFGGVATANTNTVLSLTATGLNNNWLMNRGQSRSVQFVTGAAGTIGSFSFQPSTIGQPVPVFINISATQCDFSYSQIDSPITSGFNSRACAGGAFAVQNPGSTPLASRCSLLPNTTYFLNLRNESVQTATQTKGAGQRGSDSCTYPACGFVMTVY